MAKLTLSVDSRVLSRAKRYAKAQGVSVSEMVESYLTAVVQPHLPVIPDTPILRSVRGSLKNAELGAHRKHLAEKLSMKRVLFDVHVLLNPKTAGGETASRASPLV